MTTTRTKQTTDVAPAEGDVAPAEADTSSSAPAVPSVRRLDDPELGGDPQYGILVGDGQVIRLPVVSEYQLETYDVG